MGCWNETCMVSNLPIGYNDDVVVFILLRKKTYADFNSQLYTDDAFTPVSFPVYGKYDDYGKIEETDLSFNYKMTLEYLGQENEDLLAAKNIEHAVELIQDSYHSRGDESIRFVYVMVLRDVYDYMVNSVDLRNYDAMIPVKFADVASNTLTKINEIANKQKAFDEEMEAAKTANDQTTINNLLTRQLISEMGNDPYDRNAPVDSLKYQDHKYNSPMREMIREHRKEFHMMSDEAKKEFADQLTSIMLFDIALIEHRIAWHQMAVTGQEQDDEKHRDLHQFIAARCQKQVDEYVNENYLYDENMDGDGI